MVSWGATMGDAAASFRCRHIAARPWPWIGKTQMAGGGVCAGYTRGATDDFGVHMVDDPVRVRVLEATVVHLLGSGHERLIYRHAGGDFRLPEVHGEVERALSACPTQAIAAGLSVTVRPPTIQPHGVTLRTP